MMARPNNGILSVVPKEGHDDIFNPMCPSCNVTWTLLPLKLGVYCPILEIRQVFMTFNQGSACTEREAMRLLRLDHIQCLLLARTLAFEAFSCHFSTYGPEMSMV